MICTLYRSKLFPHLFRQTKSSIMLLFLKSPSIFVYVSEKVHSTNLCKVWCWSTGSIQR